VIKASADFLYYFNSIITKGRKDNTYKFALARFLVEYSYQLDDQYIENNIRSNKTEAIYFATIARAFLKYYWHQICKYKIRQNFNSGKLPLIVQIIHEFFGTQYIPESFDLMPKDKIAASELTIEKRCFQEVIPRFQNIPEGITVVSRKVFYDYDNQAIFVNPLALRFFKDNYSLLFKAILFEWAKFLEKINLSLPMIISKIENSNSSRKSLEKFKIVLLRNSDRCFYCNNLLSIKQKELIHVDHFIPWSYIFEDELWNLVLTCRNCNLKKHSSLPTEPFMDKLVYRNKIFSESDDLLRTSLRRVSSGDEFEKVIRRYYQNCIDYGFTVVNTM
jgi:5-methylcytosine-specific restriction endonuclease McrA